MDLSRLTVYRLILKRTLDEYAAYRLNFIMWRVRMVMHLLVIFFLWKAMYQSRSEYFGYDRAMMFSYVLLSGFVRSVVLGTTTGEVARIINQGDLSNYLLKPFSFFRYYMARDTADKILNAAFALVEMSLIYLVFHPPIIVQTEPAVILQTFGALILGTMLYFSFSMTLGLLGFWLTDVWSVIFLTQVVIEFFAGGLLPLDMLPPQLFTFSRALPFFYFIFFPIKVYLGQMDTKQVAGGFFVGIIWVTGLTLLMRTVWKRGLKVYTAEGR